MFDRLVASAPVKAWSLPGTLVSGALHAGILYLAVHTTLGTRADPVALGLDTTLVFVAPENEEHSAPPPEINMAGIPAGFRALVAPAVIPTDIPPVNLRETFDPRDYSGIGREVPADVSLSGGDSRVPGTAYAEAAVDEKPEIIFSPPLPYPDVLRQAGIEGYVMVEAVVDTSGRAEPGSVRVVQSTHAAFDKPAMDVVMKSLYRPGRMQGELVRVLVNVPVTFSIRKPVA